MSIPDGLGSLDFHGPPTLEGYREGVRCAGGCYTGDVIAASLRLEKSDQKKIRKFDWEAAGEVYSP